MQDQIASPAIRAALRYWKEKRALGVIPSRAALDPAEMRSFLSHLMLLDVERAPRRYRVRLIGTHFASFYDDELTGTYLDRIDLGAMRERVLAMYDRVAASCEPSYLAPVEYQTIDGRFIQLEMAVLPLSDDGRTANILLTAIAASELDTQTFFQAIRRAFRPTSATPI